MQQTFSFFQDDFAKSKNGHYFCPFFTFPKKSWKKKYTKLYNKWIYLLKEKESFSDKISFEIRYIVKHVKRIILNAT